MSLAQRRIPCRGFTLLELLAATALLVVLGTMLFQIFSQASHVMRIGTGRQEIFQYARALIDSLETELTGAIATRDASINVANNMALSRPFRVYHSDAALSAFGLPVRPGSDALSFTSALIGRDTVQGSVTYGQVANAAHVAYWLNPSDCATLEPCVLKRYESYDIQASTQGKGWEFALNVLEFQVQSFDQFAGPPAFQSMDWESASVVSPPGARRGLPYAVALVLKLTDQDHVQLYELDAINKTSRLKSMYTPDDDPVVQQFHQVIRLREKQ